MATWKRGRVARCTAVHAAIEKRGQVDKWKRGQMMVGNI